MTTAPASPGASPLDAPSSRLLPSKLMLAKERPHLPGRVDALAIPPEHPFRCDPLAAGPLMAFSLIVYNTTPALSAQSAPSVRTGTRSSPRRNRYWAMCQRSGCGRSRKALQRSDQHVVRSAAPVPFRHNNPNPIWFRLCRLRNSKGIVRSQMPEAQMCQFMRNW